ncbi:MAG TPA: DUF2231 domain-containing protein [Acidothermaceae bacterium]|nr:DUF2231 domain-containing protein [Acidothermaceae bacterium]
MRHFSFRPSLTMAGRRNRGLRGLAGKPYHPPLTDIPITAYLFVAVFDIISAALRSSHPVTARQLYVAGLWLLLGAAAASVLAALTGWADWHRSSEPGTQARRTINAHAITMITVTVLALADLAIRGLASPDDVGAPAVVVVLSVLVALLVSFGATLGGSLVYDYGFNVETAGDHPVWHHSEVDVLPGKKAAPAPAADEALAEQA